MPGPALARCLMPSFTSAATATVSGRVCFGLGFSLFCRHPLGRSVQHGCRGAGLAFRRAKWRRLRRGRATMRALSRSRLVGLGLAFHHLSLRWQAASLPPPKIPRRLLCLHAVSIDLPLAVVGPLLCLGRQSPLAGPQSSILVRSSTDRLSCSISSGC